MNEKHAQEVADLAAELLLMAESDPHRDTENAHSFLADKKERVREIGQRLDELGGFDLMLVVYEHVWKMLQPVTPNWPAYSRGLEMAWDDIGSWRG